MVRKRRRRRGRGGGGGREKVGDRGERVRESLGNTKTFLKNKGLVSYSIQPLRDTWCQLEAESETKTDETRDVSLGKSPSIDRTGHKNNHSSSGNKNSG